MSVQRISVNVPEGLLIDRSVSELFTKDGETKTIKMVLDPPRRILLYRKVLLSISNRKTGCEQR